MWPFPGWAAQACAWLSVEHVELSADLTNACDAGFVGSQSVCANPGQE
jgi:hypothetical protein